MNQTPDRMARPEPLFLGYAFKRLLPRPESLLDQRVTHIASVSGCIAGRPSGWEQSWDFNDAGYYNDPALAAAATGTDPDEPRNDFVVFAYEFYSLRFDPRGGAVAVDPKSIFPGSHGDFPSAVFMPQFKFLGYDVVQRWAEREPGRADADRVLGGGFGCSPLSCNGLAHHHPVNRLCLLDQWDDAVTAARAAVTGQCEPGATTSSARTSKPSRGRIRYARAVLGASPHSGQRGS